MLMMDGTSPSQMMSSSPTGGENDHQHLSQTGEGTQVTALFTAPWARVAPVQNTTQTSGEKSTALTTSPVIARDTSAKKRKWSEKQQQQQPIKTKQRKMLPTVQNLLPSPSPEPEEQEIAPPIIQPSPPAPVTTPDGFQTPCSPQFYDKAFGVQVNQAWLERAANQVEKQMHLVEEMETSSSSESEKSETPSESGWLRKASQVVELYACLKKFLQQLDGYYVAPDDYMKKSVGETAYVSQVIHSFHLMSAIKDCFKPVQKCMTQCQKLYPEQVEPLVEKKKPEMKVKKQVTFKQTKKVTLPIKAGEGRKKLPKDLPLWKKVTLNPAGGGNPGKSVNNKKISVETAIQEPEGTTSESWPKATEHNTMESQTVLAEDTNSEDELYQRDTKGSLYVLSDKEDCRSDEESEDEDPDQAVRDLAVQMDLPPVDEIDKQQRANKAAAITSKMEADKLPHQQAIPDLAVHLGLPPVDNKDKKQREEKKKATAKPKVVVQTKKKVKGPGKGKATGGKKSKEPGVKV